MDPLVERGLNVVNVVFIVTSKYSGGRPQPSSLLNQVQAIFLSYYISKESRISLQ